VKELDKPDQFHRLLKTASDGQIVVMTWLILAVDVIIIRVCWSLKFIWYKLHGTAVERWFLSGELSLSCARPTANG